MNAMRNKIPVGISSCVMGNTVRYDGGHKKSRYCTDILSDILDYTVCCPEMEAGMGSPRPTLQIQVHAETAEAVISKTGQRVTSDLQAIANKRRSQIEGLSGFILTHKSPSCGIFRVKRYDAQGNLLMEKGAGIFAQQLMDNHPLLPLEEAERLNDPQLRENFLMRVIAFHEWKTMTESSVSKKNILDYYSKYKLVMLSHSPAHYKAIGKLLANLKISDAQLVAEQFIALFMDGLKQTASRRNHTNTLMHIQGYFKRKISGPEKQDLEKLIHLYRKGHIPLVAPMSIIRHHLSKHPDQYLVEQKYINPYPDDLGLRSHI